ncbi:DinB family protein [Streptomyces sp. NPDC005805]|uniref:mycothiol transferase n=1 Tax=Streptomyces sp. NPDC005805 TaxID=3157068 RepID=UPI00340B1369
MDTTALLADAFERVREAVHEAVEGLSEDELAARPEEGANTVAWLVWHLARVQDDHLADAAGREQVWTSEGWAGRFGLPFPDTATGYGHSAGDVAAVRAPASDLLGYADAVHARTLDYVRTLDAGDLDRVVDEGWDPPVTLGVRLVSVLADDLQHAGQAAYVRGLLERRG